MKVTGQRLPRLPVYLDRLRVKALFLLWGSLLGFLAILELIARLGFVRPSILVPPSEMAQALAGILLTGQIPSSYLARTGEPFILQHLWQTFSAVLASFGLGLLIGTALGVILWRSSWLERAVKPYLLLYYALPIVALYPLLILIFGIGSLPIILLGFLFSLGAIMANTYLGLREVERSVYVKVGRVLGLSPTQLVRHVYLPAAAPYFFSGFRLGFTYSIIGVIASEFITATRGIGYAIKMTFNAFDTSTMYALIILIILTTMTVALILDGIERRLNRAGWVAPAGLRMDPGRPALSWLLIPAILLVIWQLASLRFGTVFVPGIPETLTNLVASLRDGSLTLHTSFTLQALGLGILWAVGMGLILGFLIGTVPLARMAYARLILGLYSVPKVTLYPIFLLLFGLGLSSKIAFGAFHGLFPIAIYTWTGILTLKPVYLKVARSLRVSKTAFFTRIVLPAVAPVIFTGIRLGANLAFLGIILGEMLASRVGLGFLLTTHGGNFNMAQIFVVIVLVFGLALILNALLLALERLFVRVRTAPSVGEPRGEWLLAWRGKDKKDKG